MQDEWKDVRRAVREDRIASFEVEHRGGKLRSYTIWVEHGLGETTKARERRIEDDDLKQFKGLCTHIEAPECAYSYKMHINMNASERP